MGCLEAIGCENHDNLNCTDCGENKKRFSHDTSPCLLASPKGLPPMPCNITALQNGASPLLAICQKKSAQPEKASKINGLPDAALRRQKCRAAADPAPHCSGPLRWKSSPLRWKSSTPSDGKAHPSSGKAHPPPMEKLTAGGPWPAHGGCPASSSWASGWLRPSACCYRSRCASCRRAWPARSSAAW